ncbi:S8 family serine peptidase [Ideonella sp. A 288]|uniref:S8 family serine peptidase n=1 Tax=Ideonella sp. A 288 TaxID=1962181 RepID=UPI000B4B101E|nr:S8 family serine peptidase [Ideonella sp. A 288]
MTKTPWIWAAALLMAAGAASAQQAARKSYIVQLVDQPAAGYTGSVQGYAATRPVLGQKFNARAANVLAYRNYLSGRQSTVLASLGNVPVTHRYSVAFNGFTALLTDTDVAKLKANAGVAAVSEDTPRTVDTSRTPGFLGLTGSGGLHTNGVTGENVIIGIVDGGITPENPAFSDKVDGAGKPVSSHLPGTVVYNPIINSRPWAGTCQTGPGFPASACNNKLIGARHFHAGFDQSGRTRQSVEFLSPRDADGHGTHTASTAGGNAGVESVVNGSPSGIISGMAPRARIAAYKVCWLYNGSALATCFSSDSVAAIDAAVADGVDVINFSISGTRTNFVDSVEVAFLFAADAGVFVAASAGNEGPGNTVAHMSPWLTTVAASTHDRLNVATVTLGNGSTFTGPSLQAAGLPSKSLILSTEAGVTPLAGLTALQQAALRLCFSNADLADATLLGAAAGPAAALDPAKVAGKIVVCDRGANARVNKSLATKEAGGAGTIVINTAANTLNDDAHFVPTVHLSHLFRTTVRTYAAGGAGTASLSGSVLDPSVIAPQMAAFSSRGPNLANPNILKPDITAPGVNILAAYAPPLANAAQTDAQIALGNYPAPSFNYLQGTSMSSPHIAGMAALLKQAKPSWSPAAIKSALMTTATGVKLGNGAPDTDRFGYGAGHANPNAAAGVGLVYDAGFPDYAAFLCGQGLVNPTGALCNAFGFIAPWDLNLASLTSEVVGRQTFRRTVTNVSANPASYTASVTMPGFSVSVSPATLALPAGGSGSFTLTAQRTNAPLGAWGFGNLDWSDGSSTVRSPLTLKPLSLAAPAIIADRRLRASHIFTVGTGYDGTLRSSTVGLVPSTRTGGSVNFGADNCTASFDVPAGATALRIALFDGETTGNGDDDLDLEVYRGATLATATLVGSSGGTTADETVSIASPAAGKYWVCVIGFGTSRKNPDGTNATSSNYTLSSWVVAPGKGLANTLRVSTPATVVTAGTGSVAFSWAVAAGQRYFTTVQFLDGASTPVGSTALYIDSAAVLTPAPASSSKGMQKAAKLAER